MGTIVTLSVSNYKRPNPKKLVFFMNGPLACSGEESPRRAPCSGTDNEPAISIAPPVLALLAYSNTLQILTVPAVSPAVEVAAATGSAASSPPEIISKKSCNLPAALGESGP